MNGIPALLNRENGSAQGTRLAICHVRNRALLGLLLQNLVLTILTLGIYRFWAKVRFRRALWSGLQLLDDSLEYLGTARELLLGFLVVAAVLLPVSFAFFALSFQSQSWIALEFLYYVVLFYLIQFAIYRAWRYRLTRTSWRGIRFGLDGSALRFAAIVCGLSIVNMLTLGIFVPWQRAAVLRYVMGYSRFGTTSFTVNINPRWLFRQWWPVLLPWWAAGLIVLLQADTVLPWVDSFVDPAEPFPTVAGVVDFSVLFATVMAAAMVSALFWLRYRVMEFRHLAEGLGLGASRFSSVLPLGRVYRIYIVRGTAVLAALVLLGLLTIVTVLALEKLIQTMGPLIPVILGAFIVPFGLGLVRICKLLLLDMALLREVCNTLWIRQPEALEQVVQSSSASSQFGEGLADALDVGGF